MSRSLEDLAPATQALAVTFLERCEQAGHDVFVNSTLRTFFEQDELYQQGRTRPGAIVTNAEAGESRHNHGLAFDVAFRGGGPFSEAHPWDEIGAIGRAVGLEWGGDWSRFKDRPHFQQPSPFDVRTLRAAAIGRLRRGIRAARAPVEEIQRLLNQAGFAAGAVDGDFGPGTEGAVQSLQRAEGLLASGIVQLRELEALQRRLG